MPKAPQPIRDKIHTQSKAVSAVVYRDSWGRGRQRAQKMGWGMYPVFFRVDEYLLPSRRKLGKRPWLDRKWGWKSKKEKEDGVLCENVLPIFRRLSGMEDWSPISVTGLGAGSGQARGCLCEPREESEFRGVRMIDGKALWGANYLIGLMV